MPLLLRLFLLLSLALPAWALDTRPLPDAGISAFGWTGPCGQRLKVHLYLPEARDRAPVVIALHGMLRNGRAMLDAWLPAARARGLLVIAPELDAQSYPGSRSYNLGGLYDRDGRLRPPACRSYALIEPLFDEIRRRSGNRSADYLLYGHSAGAQFVHRFAYFVPAHRAHRIVAANAGVYLFPAPETAYPYGLAGAPLQRRDLVRVLGQRLLILIGAEDRDPQHRYLGRSAGALRQGEHRLARAEAFFRAGEQQARRLQVPFSWQLIRVPGVAHENRPLVKLALSAAERPGSQPAGSGQAR